MASRLLILSPQRSQIFAEFSEKFQQVLKGPCQTQVVPTISEAQKFFIDQGDPTIVFVDTTRGGFSKETPSDWAMFFQGVLELDQNACLLLITEEPPKSDEVMTWLDQGATGFIHLDFSPEKLSDSLSDMLQLRLSLARKAPRVRATHLLKIFMSSLEQATVTETLNLGHGGFFVGTVLPRAQIGDLLNFEFIPGAKDLSLQALDSSKDPLARKMDDDDFTGSLTSQGISGVGRIVWIRSLKQGHAGGAEGMGVEFVELSDRDRMLIQNFVRARRIRAFIPRQ